ncbi:DEAH-box ATP-dependent RNA helicase prp43 [Chytriomyces hyalinus]|nr:DEAH-box ATP-dependent RNA helicase prp43 [Chytriomyces hyalinus]
MRDTNTRDAILVQTSFKDALLAESGLLDVSDPAKFVKYSGLFFNELDRPVDFIENVRVSLELDLWRGGYCFTDGCGKISLDLIKTYVSYLCIGYYPTDIAALLQIRAPGIKGILVAEASLPERTIRFRKSMQKLDVMKLKSPDPGGKSHELVMNRMPLGVIGSSKLTRCSGLNSQALALLIERGLDPEIVLKKDKQYKNALMHTLVDVDSALDFLYICGYDAEFAKMIEILNLEHARKSALQRFWGDLQNMLKVVRKEIMNSRTNAASEFGKFMKRVFRGLRLRAGYGRDPIQVATFKPREEPHHVDITMRLLNLGRQTQNREHVVTSLLGRAELMGALVLTVSQDLVSLCVEVVSGLESVIEEHLATFQLTDLTDDRPAAEVVATCEKRQAELDKLLSRHESFASMISSVADMINAHAVQMDTPLLLSLEKVLRNEIEMLQTYRANIADILGGSNQNKKKQGSGKSTCTPNFIANTLFFQTKLSPSKQVLVAQPRRNATTSLAERLALSRSTKISDQVGFHIEKTRARTNKDRTILTCVTYGILLAYARKDAYLRGFSVIVLDEVHENSADLHFLFGILKHALRVNLELKIVLMSASVDFTKMTRFFNGCATVHVDGRSHPVEEEFVGTLSFNRADYVRDAVFQCIRIHEQCDVLENGDILVFLPTVQDINDAVKLVSEFAKKNEKYRNLRGFPLFSSMSEQRKQFILNRLPIEEWNRLNTSHDRFVQDFEADEGEWDIDEGDFFMYENDEGEIVQFIPEKKKSRRVIFCTNIAETSLTIPSVGYVVDCGLQYSVEHSPIMRIVDSKLVPTTKVSAVQRMGRAGRLGPGKCIRMYSFEEQGELVSQAYSSPKNFDLRILHIIETFKDIRNFEWFKQPLDAELAWTYSVLTESGFLLQSPTSHHQQITRDGEFALDLGRLEIPANIALFILRIWRATCTGQHHSIRNQCLTIAAFLAVGNRKVFQNRYLYSKIILDGYFELVKYPTERVLPSSFTKVNLYNIWSNIGEPLRDNFCTKNGIIPRGMYTVHDLRDELQRFMFEKSGFIAETRASEHMGRLSTAPEDSFEKLEFLLGHLASACFTHIGYKTNEGDVLFICDSKTETAEIERMEEDSLAGKERCKLVLFHSLRRQTDPRQNGKSCLIVGAIDPLPWAWPEKIPDRFIAQYAGWFPEFP